jgi:hypothetical protein
VLWSDGLESWKACDEPIKIVGAEPEVRQVVLRLQSGCPLWPRQLYEIACFMK